MLRTFFRTFYRYNYKYVLCVTRATSRTYVTTGIKGTVFTLVDAIQRLREEKSLRHVAKVAKCLDDNKPIKSLKSLFALFQTSPILSNFL